MRIFRQRARTFSPKKQVWNRIPGCTAKGCASNSATFEEESGHAEIYGRIPEREPDAGASQPAGAAPVRTALGATPA